MTLEELNKSLKKRLSLPLPGPEAQYQMAHAERRRNAVHYQVPETSRKGSVLLLLYEDQGRVMMPLIERPVYEGVHSGQVALPGGSFEATDKTFGNTAIREANEEIGIVREDVELAGGLSTLYIPPSNFLVYPFIGSITYRPFFKPDPLEVKSIIEMDLDKIMDEKRIRDKTIKLSNGLELLTPCFDIDGVIVWGATAMILSEFKSVLFEIGY
jgi:8-oxo-dGTP pyrophosphatase MutT (NUDIX family)